MTTDPQWEQARDLFLDIAELPPDQHDRELAGIHQRDPGLAARVRELLRNDRTDAASTTTTGPRRYGPYEVVRPLGQGGMGEVVVARRADGEYEREVAIKVLRGGTANEELVRRFLRERQTLAQLDHEYIAHLLDGGTTERGEPYLVMEYVDGERADAFAMRLDLRERLELFIRIGQAVSHAHERGFVHRDLKPSNILVRPDGTPRLLDFGIALPDAQRRPSAPDEEPLTRTGHRVFTPEYASPEQIQGQVATPQSDVFALGVLLYVFLSGERPWATAANLHELERSICEDDPSPPSRLVTGTTRRRLSGDLDAVVMQCLAKRPKHRYASVADLCSDLRAYLDGRPVKARRTSTLGRAMRFTRRKPAYAVACVLMLATGVATWLAWSFDRQRSRSRADLSAAVADRVSAAQLRISDGELDAADEQLDDALSALDSLPGEAALTADVLVHKALVASFRQDYDQSLDHLDGVEAQLERIDSPDPRLVTRMLNTRANVLFMAKRPGSREAARAALDFAQANLAPGEVLRLDAILDWADELRREGKVEEALEQIKQAVSEARDRDPRNELLSRMLNEQAIALAAAERPEEAVACYREALDILTWHRGERNPAFSKLRLNLGATLFRLGRLREAEEEFERSLASSRPLQLDQVVAANQHFLGRIHCSSGTTEDLRVAEAAAREAIAILERLGLENHADRSRCLLGIILAKTGRPLEARDTLSPLLTEVVEGRFVPEMEAEARYQLGAILDDAGETAAARVHLIRALELKRQVVGAPQEECEEIARRLAD